MASDFKDFVIDNLRGGQNDDDPPHSLPDDQVVLAENVEFWSSTIGERRRGCSTVVIDGSNLNLVDVIIHLTPHYPLGAEVSEAELWAVGATLDVVTKVARRASDGTWSDIPPVDAILSATPDVLRIDSQSVHGKLYITYKSGYDRMHVWDGTTLRRTGIAEAGSPPTVIDTAVGGSYTGDRTFRVRFITKSGSDVILRSNPSPEVTFTPAGSFNGAIITRPTAPGDSETHWEVEADDTTGNFYVIAEVALGTTTYTDTTLDPLDYADGDLSEDAGDYDNIPSVKYVKVDQDRLIFGGSWEDPEKDSRVSWTPVAGATGVGNDERIPLDTDNFVDLDWMDGGGLTGLSDPLNGSFYAFKLGRIYKLQRTGRVDGAYEAFLLSKSRGALPGSIITGIDEYGRGCVYFLDPSIGPTRISGQGIQAMKNLLGTWNRVNTAAALTVCHGIYYPDKQQVHWWLTVDSEDNPNFRIISQVNEVRSTTNGTERGWSVATGRSSEAWCSAVIPEVIVEEDGTLGLGFRPMIGLDTPDYIQRMDSGTTDAGVAYRGIIRTKPYILAGLLNRWGAMAAALLATAISDPSVLLNVKFIRNFGIEENDVTTDFLPVSVEDIVIKQFDNLRMSDVKALQVEFSDP